MPRPLIEPFRIKAVEPIRLTTRPERVELLSGLGVELLARALELAAALDQRGAGGELLVAGEPGDLAHGLAVEVLLAVVLLGVAQQPAVAGVELDEAVDASLRPVVAVEVGVANELAGLTRFLNAHHAPSAEEQASLDEVRALAATCTTGCAIPAPAVVVTPAPWKGFLPELTRLAAAAH